MIHSAGALSTPFFSSTKASSSSLSPFPSPPSSSSALVPSPSPPPLRLSIHSSHGAAASAAPPTALHRGRGEGGDGATGNASAKPALRKKKKAAPTDKPVTTESLALDAAAKSALQAKLAELLSNAQRLNGGSSQYPARYSLGIDFGDARTGVAVSKGFAPRPLAVVELRGEKLEARLLQLAEKEMAEEFIVGLPKSSDGSETSQSNKVRCFAGRLACRAAERGWRVYLHDEYGTSSEALDYMIVMGSKRKDRRTQLDAYAAVMVLRSYFDNVGRHAELVVPKNMSLQQRLCEGPKRSFSNDELGEDDDNEL